MSKSRVHIRPAAEADAPVMARMLVDTWLSAHKGQIPEEQWRRRRDQWTYDVSARGWVDTLRALEAGKRPRECLYVAVEGAEAEAADAVIGLVMGGPAKVGPWEDAGEIYALYVRTDRQRRGVGRRLLQTAVDHLAGLGMTALVIRCLDANAPANRFYERLGGQVIGHYEREEGGFRNLERIYGWRDSASLRAA